MGNTTYSFHISWCKNVTSSEWERVRVVHHWQLAIPRPHQAKHQGQAANAAAIGASLVGTSTWLVAGQTLLSPWGRDLFPHRWAVDCWWQLTTLYNDGSFFPKCKTHFNLFTLFLVLDPEWWLMKAVYKYNSSNTEDLSDTEDTLVNSLVCLNHCCPQRYLSKKHFI